MVRRSLGRRFQGWPCFRLLCLLLLALLDSTAFGMSTKWKDWWANYDETKPPQYWQLPYAASASMTDYKSPSSPFPEPPPPTAQGFQGSGHFWPPPPMPPPSPPPPLPPPPPAPTKKSFQSAVPHVSGGSFGTGTIPPWSSSTPSLAVPPTGGQGAFHFKGKSANVVSQPRFQVRSNRSVHGTLVQNNVVPAMFVAESSFRGEIWHPRNAVGVL